MCSVIRRLSARKFSDRANSAPRCAASPVWAVAGGDPGLRLLAWLLKGRRVYHRADSYRLCGDQFNDTGRTGRPVVAVIVQPATDWSLPLPHRTFAWGSDARGKAHVHVVILGLDRRENTRAEKRLFFLSQPQRRLGGKPATLRFPLTYFDASGLADPHLTAREESQPINGMRRLKTGVQMIDNGILTFSKEEKESFLAVEPFASRFFPTIHWRRRVY